MHVAKCLIPHRLTQQLGAGPKAEATTTGATAADATALVLQAGAKRRLREAHGVPLWQRHRGEGHGANRVALQCRRSKWRPWLCRRQHKPSEYTPSQERNVETPEKRLKSFEWCQVADIKAMRCS